MVWLLLACAPPVPAPERASFSVVVDPRSEWAAGATRDPELRALFEAWWSHGECALAPRLDVVSPGRCFEGAAAPDRAALEALRARAAAADVERLDDFDRVNLQVFRWVVAQPLEPTPRRELDYAGRLREITAMDLDPEALHRRGLAEVGRLQGRVAALAAEQLGTRGFPQARDALRQPSWFYADQEELLADVLAAIREGEAVAAAAFPLYAEEACKPGFGLNAIGSYDESELHRDGVWWVDTTPGAGLPRYALRPQAFHECWPGHHFQLTNHKARQDWPRFRRLALTTGYVEGWGTYAEQVMADDLGLYSAPRDRLGLAVYELWRWARVAVDTGLHRRGWSAEQARAFLKEQTPLPDHHVAIELKRMQRAPGRMVGHALGLDAFREARAAAEAAAGERFDAVAFDVFLYELGPAPPEVLRAEAARWGEARAAAP